MSDDHLPVKLTPTATAWRDHILAWQTSGLTQQAYCDQHHVKLAQFWNWKSKFNQAGITQKGRRRPSVEPFVAVEVTDHDAGPARTGVDCTDSGVIITMGNRFEIRLNRSFDPAVLITVVKVLGGSSCST